MPLSDDLNIRSVREEELRESLSRVTHQLATIKLNREELIEAVYRAARDAASGLTIPPVAPPVIKSRRRRLPEVAVPLVSDLQLAKVTPDYNTAVCEERMERYADKIIELTETQRSDHPVDECVILALGDIIEGELIFPGQSFLVDASLYRQVAVDGPRIMTNFIRRMLSNFKKVTVYWVIGNHGRIGGREARNMDPESNADRMLGRIVMNLFEMMGEKRLTFVLPDGSRERNWFTVARVGNWSALCFHGDQIRGSMGFPWYGLGKKVNSWAAGAIREPFKDVAMGHYHQISAIPLNNRTVWANGSTESYNTYAQENMASMSDPAQWLLFVHPEKGRVTAAYQVDLLA